MTARRASWRRRALRAVVCLLLGAVTTVGVAWGFAWRLQRGAAYITAGRMSAPFIVEYDEVLWMGHERRAFGFRCTVLQRVRTQAVAELPDVQAMRLQSLLDSTPRREARALPSWVYWPSEDALLGSRPPGWPPPFTDACDSHAFGWPIPAVRGAVIEGRWPEWIEYWVPNGPGRRALPYGLVPAGAALDTLFYAVPWWALLVTPGLINRWRRKRRGACLACGYNLRGLGEEKVCPECGSA